MSQRASDSGEPEQAAAAEKKHGGPNPWGPILAGFGVLALIASAIMHWAVVPNRKELPADTNTVRQFDGTAKVLLNPLAVATGDLANALATNVPVTAERGVRALATDGNAAQVQDVRTLNAGGQVVGHSDVNYAVNRKTLEATTDYPSDWQVTPHEGLTVSWPIGAEKKDYTAWINDTKSAIPVTYTGEESRDGVNTYVYEANSTAAPITDETALSILPKGLPPAALIALAPSLQLPEQVKQALIAALPQLGATVPLAYTYEVKSKYWVEPTTGLVVDTNREEIRNATISVGGTQLASLPVYDVETHFTPASIKAAAHEATDKRDSINLVGTTLPVWLAILGLLSLFAGVFVMMGRRHPTPQPVTAGPVAVATQPPPPTMAATTAAPPPPTTPPPTTPPPTTPPPTTPPPTTPPPTTPPPTTPPPTTPPPTTPPPTTPPPTTPPPTTPPPTTPPPTTPPPTTPPPTTPPPTTPMSGGADVGRRGS